MRRGATAAFLALVAVAVHRLGRRSGATDAETLSELPGDGIVARPRWQSSRATSIDAPAEEVWPWIVQMGFPKYRAGWYTPYWLDRAVWGIRWRSADEIHPELSSLDVGDRVPDSADWSTYFDVVDVEPPRALVLRSSRHLVWPVRELDFSWAFVLRNEPFGGTRLLIRSRVDYEPWWAWPLLELVVGPADRINTGAMLRGIRARAMSTSVQKARRAVP
ncbi:MAG TPA: hypothetical protein VH306_10040 [Gaiellaceae bacterium]|jgi:hypothetical protein